MHGSPQKPSQGYNRGPQKTYLHILLHRLTIPKNERLTDVGYFSPYMLYSRIFPHWPYNVNELLIHVCLPMGMSKDLGVSMGNHSVESEDTPASQLFEVRSLIHHHECPKNSTPVSHLTVGTVKLQTCSLPTTLRGFWGS